VNSSSFKVTECCFFKGSPCLPAGRLEAFPRQRIFMEKVGMSPKGSTERLAHVLVVDFL